MEWFTVITKFPLGPSAGQRSDLLVFFEGGALIPDLYPTKLAAFFSTLADEPPGHYDLVSKERELCNSVCLILAHVDRDDPETFIDAAREGGVVTFDLRMVVPSFVPMPLLARMLVEGALNDKLNSCEVIVAAKNIRNFRADLGRQMFTPSPEG